MRSPALLLLVAAAFATFPAAPDPARAQDADPAAAAFYEKGIEGLGGRAADALWKAADAARKLGLHACACEAAERALAYDPDHKRARKHLGFVRKRGEWVVDPEAAGAVRRQDERANGTTPAAFEALRRRWRDDDLRAADAEIAGLHADLGERCAAKGHAAEARRARDEALRLDPDCAKARKALGYERVGEAWLTAAQKAAREAASKPEVFREASHLDEVLGLTLTKARSANVVAESAFDEERTCSLVHVLETTYTYYLTDVRRDPNEHVFRAPVQAAFLQSGAQWSRWLDDRAPKSADFYRPLGFHYNGHTLLLGVREIESMGAGAAWLMEDNAVHGFTHVLNQVLWGLRAHAWLDEGLAYYYTLKVRGTTESWCVEATTSRYAADGGTSVVEKATEGDFRRIVKELVVHGDDMDLRMLSARGLNELKLPETAKAWSVATWLMETDRDGALRLFGALAKAPSGAAALEEQLNRSVEETDEAWRAWVRRTH